MRTGRKSAIFGWYRRERFPGARPKSFSLASLYLKGFGRMTRRFSVRSRGVRAPQSDEPAFTIFARAAGEDDLQMESIDVPGVLGVVRANVDRIGLEKVLSRRVLAMIVVDPPKEREL